MFDYFCLFGIYTKASRFGFILNSLNNYFHGVLGFNISLVLN